MATSDGKITVQGLGNPVPAADGVREGHLKSIYSDFPDLAVVPQAATSDNATGSDISICRPALDRQEAVDEEGTLGLGQKLTNLQLEPAHNDDSSSKVGTGSGIGREFPLDTAPSTSAAAAEKMSEAIRLAKVKTAYRKSLAYLRKMRQKGVDTLSVREKTLIKKHERLVAKFEKNRVAASQGKPKEANGVTRPVAKAPVDNSPTACQRPNPSDKSHKRTRSDGTPRQEAKKMKPSASFDTPIDLQVAIIDSANPDGKITPEQWLLVEAGLMELMLKADSDELLFNGAGWQKGVKVVGCENRKSLDFLTRAISCLGAPWPGAKLEVIPRTRLPVRPVVLVWIPPPIPRKETILGLIGRQNPLLGTERWQLISLSACKNGTGSDALIAVDQPSLDRIKSCQGSIRFGLGTLKIRVPGDRPQSTRDAAAGSAN